MAEDRAQHYILGSSSTTVTLTANYSDNRSGVISIGSNYQVALNVAYTMGAAETSNAIVIAVEYSPNGTDWYRQSAISTSSGTSTVSQQEYSCAAVSAAATYDYFHISVPVDDKFIRVSVKETGVAANYGSAKVAMTLTEDHN